MRSFARENAETAKFIAMNEATSALSKQAASARGVFMGGLSAAANASLVAVLYFGGSLVARGDMTVSKHYYYCYSNDAHEICCVLKVSVSAQYL